MKPKTIEETKQHFSGDLPGKNQYYHLGGFELDKPYEDQDAYKSLKWLINHLGITLKKTTWGEIAQLIKDDKLHGWNQLQSQSFTYHYFLPHGYTEKPENPEIHIINNNISLEAAADLIINYLLEKDYIKK